MKSLQSRIALACGLCVIAGGLVLGSCTSDTTAAGPVGVTRAAIEDPSEGGVQRFLDSDVFKVASSIASLVGGVYGDVFGVVKQLGSLYSTIFGGGGGEGGLSAAIMKQLTEIQRTTEETLSAVLVGDDLARERETISIVEHGLTWVQTVRDAVADGQETPGELTTPTFTALDQATMYSVQTLTNDAYWQRAYAESTLKGEWLEATEMRPAHPNGRVFERRTILPMYMHAIATRIVGLALLDTEFAANGRWSGELQGYANFLRGKLDTIEAGIACGFTYYMQGNKCGVYGMKAICADIYTNESLEHMTWGHGANNPATGRISHCAWLKDPDKLDFEHCRTECAFPGPDVKWGGDGVNERCPGCDDERVTLRDPTSEFAQNGTIQYGLDDVRQALRQKLGIFEVRRMIDTLENLAHNAPMLTLEDTAQLPSFGFPGRVVQIAAAASFPPPDFTPVFLGDQSEARVLPAQRWSYDPLASRIWQVGVYELGQTFYCLDAHGDGTTRAGTQVTLRPCNTSDDQRWTYNRQTGILLNAKGRVLDTQGGASDFGTGLWLWDEHGGTSQQWGQ